jgi:hypothetical protein
MLHLPADRLIELVDIEPTPQELAHLQSCTECARERNALMALRNLAADARMKGGEPLSSWERLRPALLDEDLIEPTTGERPALVRPKRGFGIGHWSVRMAASIALVAGGVLGGRLTAPVGVVSEPASEQPAAVQAAAFSSTSDAMDVLLRAQEDYQRAAAFLLASDTTLGPSTPALYKQRLAALDELMGVTRSALSRVPQDPVINSYYLAALGAREATLQQLELALPEGTRIDRF